MGNEPDRALKLPDRTRFGSTPRRAFAYTAPMIATAVELLGLRVTLRPLRDGLLLPFSGRAIHAWWLDVVRAADPALAARLHNAPGRRPFTCSSLAGLPGTHPGTRVPADPARPYQFRLSAWDAAVVPHLIALRDAPPAVIPLGGIAFAVESVTQDALAPPTTFAALAAAHLLLAAADAPPRDVTLRFETATSFRQSAQDGVRPAPLPFPLPSLVWGSLFDRWQEGATVGLDPAIRTALATRIAVSRFCGESQRVLIPGIGDPSRTVGATGGRWVVGFVGDCTYWWPKRDGYLGGVLRLLGAFAAYAGVGHGTATGLGQAWMLGPHPPPQP